MQEIKTTITYLRAAEIVPLINSTVAHLVIPVCRLCEFSLWYSFQSVNFIGGHIGDLVDTSESTLGEEKKVR